MTEHEARARARDLLSALEEACVEYRGERFSQRTEARMEALEIVTQAFRAADAAALERVAQGWKEATIAWSVCASIHREYAKRRDALYTTRQADFLKHETDARQAYSVLAAELEREEESGKASDETDIG